jgi:hypothetical protein
MDQKRKPEEKKQEDKDRPKEYINGREVEYVEPKTLEELSESSTTWVSKER